MCGYVHSGKNPPEECPQCSSSSRDFVENAPRKPLKFDGKKFDVLLINGSSHKGNNTSIIAGMTEKFLKARKVSYRRYNLNECDVRHCWCCYSMYDKACTYPCRNQLDDMPAFHEMLEGCKAVIVASPINWNNMSARLKDFLDRLTCIENLPLAEKRTLVAGKVFGIVVNGHEDGGMKTALDIFVYFQQLGFIMAPFGFAYKTHGGEFNSKTDRNFFLKNEKLERDVEGVVHNVVEMMKFKLEEKIRKNIKLVCE